jgi:hypothetical protein
MSLARLKQMKRMGIVPKLQGLIRSGAMQEVRKGVGSKGSRRLLSLYD